MLKEISRVLKIKGFYICVSYGDPDIRNHLFEDKLYEWTKLTNSPYKVFKPNIEQTERDIVFDDKDKEKNKDYYHYVYIMQKNNDLIQNPLDSQFKSSNIALNSFSR
jgi:ubiquinone/menaquinone biosynthesis C-methylase UbiE